MRANEHKHTQHSNPKQSEVKCMGSYFKSFENCLVERNAHPP